MDYLLFWPPHVRCSVGFGGTVWMLWRQPNRRWCRRSALVPPRGNYSTRTGLRMSSRTEPKKWVQRCQNHSLYLMKSVLRVSNWLLTRWCLTNKPHTSVHRQFVSPIMDSNTIVGNITEPKADGAATLTKRVIDATVDPMS